MPKIQDSQGRTMEVSDYIFDMAKGYGWTSETADEGLARVMEEIRSDEENSIGAGQSLGGAAESHSIIEFCRGGPSYNSAFKPAYAASNDDLLAMGVALDKLAGDLDRAISFFESEVKDIKEQVGVLAQKVLGYATRHGH